MELHHEDSQNSSAEGGELDDYSCRACSAVDIPEAHLLTLAAYRERGPGPDHPMTFPSVEVFYQDDGRRRRSREVDLGRVTRPGALAADLRVSWVEDTGDLYLVPQDGYQVDLVARIETREAVDLALGGVIDGADLDYLLGQLRTWFS